MNSFEELYNRANKINNEKKEDIEDVIYVSFLDVLKEKKVTKKVLQPVPCLCVDPNNVNDYYQKCPKCKGKKEIELLSHRVICNACKGKGLIVKEDCPLCHNSTQILKKSDVEINLSRELLNNPNLIIEEKGKNMGNLRLKVEIYDKDFYFIENDNVYSKKILFFNKKEFKSSKEIETVTSKVNIKLDKIVYEQVIVLKEKGLNGKDFYQPVRCEVEGEKGENIYKNLIIDEVVSGVYITNQSLFGKEKVLECSKTKPLNDDNYIYLDLKRFNKNYDVLVYEQLGHKSLDGGKRGDLFVKVFVGNYFIKDDILYRTDEILTKTEMSNEKKSIIVNGEKTLVNMKNENDFNYFLNMGKFGLLDKDNKMGDFYTLINKGKSLYKISTYATNRKFYIEDYKHFFNEKVNSYENTENMENYVCFDNALETYDKDGNKVVVSLLKKGEL